MIDINVLFSKYEKKIVLEEGKLTDEAASMINEISGKRNSTQV